jgi:hypothetical protein
MHREEAKNWKCWEPPGVVFLFHDFLVFFEVFFWAFMLDFDSVNFEFLEVNRGKKLMF